MKILVLCSGGDGSGMNRFLFDLNSHFRGDVFFALAGFKGLIDNQIFPLEEVLSKNVKDSAGTVIKSSRCPEFQEKKPFAAALENAKKFDCVVILGGNGSEKGAKELFDNGVNTIFVPGTVDNDVFGSAYSIGFSTAVNESVYAVKSIMPSIESMGNSCLFEVMGRYCPAIAKAVAQRVHADYVVADKKDLDFEKIKNVILQNFVKNKSACIIVRENIQPIEKIAQKLNELLGFDHVKYQIVGRTQRGGKPTKEELEMASKFAKETAFCIKNGVFGVRVLADENMDIIVDEFKEEK